MLGQTSNRKIIAVIVVLLISCIFIYGRPSSTPSIKKVSLAQAFDKINGWKAGSHIPFDNQVVESLLLDDYLNRYYRKGEKEISLYIGYYLTSGKIGAAHDPLVCFPGQGWKILSKEKGAFDVNLADRETVKYSAMIVEKDMEKSVILYWFQTYDDTNADTFTQKLSYLVQKIQGNGEDNAFVRISCTLNEKNEQECHASMEEFAREFYPIFLQYIKDNKN